MEKGRFVSRPCVIPTWLPCKDLSFADSFVINKGNGSVTRGLVHLTEQWNFGEPIQLNNGTVAYKMSVTSKSSVILFIYVKSRRSYLTDKELSNVNCTGFVKLIAQNMTNNSGWKNSKGKAKKRTFRRFLRIENYLRLQWWARDKLDNSIARLGHRSRRQSSFPKFLNAYTSGKKVIGINMKVNATIHIEPMKEFYVGELDKAEFDLILQLGSSSTVNLLRHSIDTTKKPTKKKKGLGIIALSA